MSAFKLRFRSFDLFSTHSMQRRKLRSIFRLFFFISFVCMLGEPLAVVAVDCDLVFPSVHKRSSSEFRHVAHKRLLYRTLHSLDGCLTIGWARFLHRRLVPHPAFCGLL